MSATFGWRQSGRTRICKKKIPPRKLICKPRKRLEVEICWLALWHHERRLEHRILRIGSQLALRAKHLEQCRRHSKLQSKSDVNNLNEFTVCGATSRLIICCHGAASGVHTSLLKLYVWHFKSVNAVSLQHLWRLEWRNLSFCWENDKLLIHTIFCADGWDTKYSSFFSISFVWIPVSQRILYPREFHSPWPTSHDHDRPLTLRCRVYWIR